MPPGARCHAAHEGGEGADQDQTSEPGVRAHGVQRDAQAQRHEDLGDKRSPDQPRATCRGRRATSRGMLCQAEATCWLTRSSTARANPGDEEDEMPPMNPLP